MVCCKAYSQEDSSIYRYSKGFLDSINIDDLIKRSRLKSHFRVQTSYISNSVYQGRKDTASLPYITPTLIYNHKSGLYASTSFSYLANSNSRVDATSVELGFNFDTSHHFGGSLCVNKSFYNSNSSNVRSDIKFTTSGTLNYESAIVNATLSGDFMLGASKNDIALMFSLAHPFSWENDSSKTFWSIAPTFSMFSGTSGSYQSNKTKLLNRRSGQSKTYTINVSSVSPFQLMSYEFSLPISFDKEKWGIFLTPTYSVAVNPITTTYKITKANGQLATPPLPAPFDKMPLTQTEKISNSFFVECGIYVSF